MRRLLAPLLAAVLLSASAAAGLLCARTRSPEEKVIAAYTTSLANRSAGQIENAVSAVRTLNGAVVRPGEVFSFNRRVGPWTADRGYRRAPVSYDGEITLAVGGGVCQLSTTLYGAALMAGMDIVERHRHFWPVNYAKPGLDAAVAFPAVDLRFRNPLPTLVRIRARRQGDRLIAELLSTTSPGRWEIESERLAVQQPMTLVRPEESLERGRLIRSNRGQPGMQVAVYRLHQTAHRQWERALISVDTYPVLNRVIKIGCELPSS